MSAVPTDRRDETGHDRIVRRLLASHEAEVDALPPADRAALVHGCTGKVLPALEAFAGARATWQVSGAALGSWDDTGALAVVGPLLRDGRLVALIGGDPAFTERLMGALFGTVPRRRPDPTASELAVLAQLVVRLRDCIEPALDHAAPGPPDEVLRLHPAPAERPIAVRFGLEGDDGGAAELSLLATRAALQRVLPSEAQPLMSALPLAAEVQLVGSRQRLRDVAALAVGQTLAAQATARLLIGRREIASGQLGRNDGGHTFTFARGTDDE